MTHNLISGTVIPYSGKFSRGSNFRDFRDPRPKRENTKPRKFERVNFLSRAFCALASLDLTSDYVTIALFKPTYNVLPFPT